MPETNHYQAPGNTEASATLERRLASMLLVAREKDYTLGLHYRWQFKGYVVLAIAISIAIAYFSWLGIQPMVFVMIGVLAGSLVRDYGIARRQTKVWKIQTELLDWDKVQRMAAGEPLDS